MVIGKMSFHTRLEETSIIELMEMDWLLRLRIALIVTGKVSFYTHLEILIVELMEMYRLLLIGCVSLFRLLLLKPFQPGLTL